MKSFRLPGIIALVMLALLLLAVGVAFNSSFQTWLVRRQLAKQPGLKATVGQVSAGLKQVEVKDARFERAGAVLSLPALHAQMPLIDAGLRDKVAVSNLVAKGWTLDLSKVPDAVPPAGAMTPAGSATVAAAAAAQAFGGIFQHLQLPVDVAVDGVDLEGDVILPALRGRVKVALRGGGLGVGREGKFDLRGDAALADPAVNAVGVRGTIATAMDTPRSFTRVGAKIDADARGSKFPNGVKLTAELSAARAAAGETYSVAVATPERELLALSAAFPQNAQRLAGTWKLDARAADVAPFALGQPLPDFTATGEGRFDADPRFVGVRATGRLDVAADKLATIMPQLSEVGAIKLVADFDVARHGDAITVEKLSTDIAAGKPVARVRSLQAFEFNPRTAGWKAADPARALFEIALAGVPLAWAKPYLPNVAVSGGDLRGELVATARGGGVTLRTKEPLSIENLTATVNETPMTAGKPATPAKPLAEKVDATVEFSADYTPQGWQTEIAALSLKTGDTQLLTLEAKAGQLAGANQPVKATGKLSAELPALLRQPTMRGVLALTAGEATVDFAASLAAKKEIQAKVALKGLVADPKATEKLPTLTADVRADLAADGLLTLNAPIAIERESRRSDLTFAGTFKPGKNTRTLDARVTSNQLVIDDAKLLAALVPEEKESTEPAKPKSAPPWAGLNGTVTLQLKKVVYAATFQATDIAGTVRIEGGALKLETVRAGLGEGGEAKLTGAVTFEPAAAQPYALTADLNMTDFDPGALLRALVPNQPPTIEGRFNVASKVAGRALTLGELAAGAGGEFQMTSRGGVFRGLPVNASNLAENTSKIAAWIASAGSAIGALTGKKEASDVANKAQAVAEFAKGLNPIPFDQLSVIVARDEALNTTLKDFTLISPELRLTGSGQATHRAGTPMIDDALTMEFSLRARGRQGDLLKYLGALESQPDDLGYAVCTLPLKVGGTLSRPDTTELNARLASLALDKSGLGDKAAEFINKLRGGGGGGK